MKNSTVSLFLILTSFAALSEDVVTVFGEKTLEDAMSKSKLISPVKDTEVAIRLCSDIGIKQTDWYCSVTNLDLSIKNKMQGHGAEIKGIVNYFTPDEFQLNFSHEFLIGYNDNAGTQSPLVANGCMGSTRIVKNGLTNKDENCFWEFKVKESNNQ